VSLFKVNRGNEIDLPTELNDGWIYFCVDTGRILIDHYNSTNNLVRSKVNAECADTLRYVQDGETIELTPQDINIALNNKADKTETSDLNDRIDDVENSINITNQTLNGVSQEFESYKTTNNDAVSTNASGIASNKDAIEEIQGDYLMSTDKTQLQDDISKVSEKATANASAIEILNGEGDGSVKQSIDNAFNEFAANVTNDDVVNTYKELIDYAATHGPEFVALVGEVDTIDSHVGEIEAGFIEYQDDVSERFTEVDTIINNHVDNTNNPHGVTKESIGLSNVDDTSDMNKPISSAMQAALDEKADIGHVHDNIYYTKDEVTEVINEHASNIENPHDVTKEQIGLANVDNTSDMDKPISYATQAVLDEKADANHDHDNAYYTKDELSEMFELITIDDIDTICLGPIISFTIGDTLYRAIEGMTWAEWVDSRFNTGMWYIGSETYIERQEGTISGVATTDVIMPNNAYTISVGKTISFTIGDTLYRAIEGMTWAEWVKSGYNVDGWYVSGEYVDGPDCTMPGVFATDEIIPDNVYQAFYW